MILNQFQIIWPDPKELKQALCFVTPFSFLNDHFV